MSGSDRELRVGVVGVGGRGLQLATYWLNFPGARLVAIADFLPDLVDRATAIGEGITGYASHTDLLEHANVDILTVGTTGQFHAGIVEDAAAAGIKAIYVEKPFASSLGDADRMIDACRASGTVLQVGHQRRWLNGTTHARQAILDGAIGMPTFGYLYWPTGRIGSNGTHFFDALNFILDSKPVEVVGRVQYGLDLNRVEDHPNYGKRSLKDPGCFGIITFENGARIAVDALNDVLLPYTYMFGGSKGRIDLEEGSWCYDLRERPEDIRSHRASWDVPNRLPMLALDEEAGIAERVGYQEMIDAIKNGTPVTSPGEAGRLALETIVAFHLSSEAGMTPVSLPLPESANDIQLDIH